ncbi:MAG: hybrid sensor histidine kinase/response regulator [Thermodesulfobacteriota bacterium]
MIVSRLFKRVLLVVVSLFIVIGVLSSVFSAWILRERLVDDYISRAESIVNTISVSVPDLFLKHDAASIQSIIDQYLSEKGVGYVYVLDEDKNIVAHTFTPSIPDSVEHTVSAREKAQIVNQRVMFDGYEYIDVGGSVLRGEGGYVHVGMKMSTINSIIFKNLLNIQLFNLFLFVISVGILYILMDRISRPLTQLTGYAHRLAEKDFSAELDIKSNDEVGDLAQSMDYMGRQLSGFVDRLQRAVNNATHELQETLTYLHAILDNLADGLVVTDESGKIIRYNLAFKTIFDISEKNIVEQNLQDYCPRTVVQMFDTDSQSEAQRQDIVHEDADGEKKYIEATLTFVSMSCGLNYIFIFHDITRRQKSENELRVLYDDLDRRVIERTRELERTNELLQSEIELRKQAEEQLMSEKELFSVTLKSIGDGVVTTDNFGDVIFVNMTAEGMLGSRMQDVQGSPFSKVCRLVDGNDNLIDPVREVLSQGGIFERKRGMYLVSERDGSMGHVDVSFKTTPIYDRQSLVLGTVTVFQDITEFVRMEEARFRKEKLESIGVLAGGIAHDFNNLLTAVLNHILLVKMNLEVESREFSRLNDAQNAILRSKQLTQQLLTFSRGGAPIRETTSLPELIDGTVGFALRGANVKSHIQMDKNLWPANIDSGQIAQVFENLVLNSVQAMPEGGNIYIYAANYAHKTTEEGPGLSPGNYIRIDFKDDGPGISEENLDRIFDPYFTTKEIGNGLGLASCYSIIKNHMGEITVSSEPGQGVHFVVYLPAVAAGQNLKKHRTASAELKFGHGRILVMDDVQDILDIMHDALELLGYEGHFAKTGEQAVKMYETAFNSGQEYDAVILDLTIPGGMGGREAVGEILKINPKAKVLVSSGYSQDPVMGNFKDYGFCGVLPKPYTVEDVSRTLNEVLSG